MYDFCIIGSGPAGAFLADDLEKKGHNICIVEAGNKSVNTDIKEIVNIKNSEIQGTINYGLSTQIGGSSNLWAGGLAKLDEIDLLKREQFGFEGWGLTYEELNNIIR